MCISAGMMILGGSILASAIGTVASIETANNNARLAAYENAVRSKELRDQRNMARLEAMQLENSRGDEFRRMRSAAMAAIGASGIQDHISFFQGQDPAQKKAFAREVSAIRLNLRQQEVGIKDQIEVGGFGVQIAKANAGAAKIGALANFMKEAAQAASFYAKGA